MIAMWFSCGCHVISDIILEFSILSSEREKKYKKREMVFGGRHVVSKYHLNLLTAFLLRSFRNDHCRSKLSSRGHVVVKKHFY